MNNKLYNCNKLLIKKLNNHILNLQFFGHNLFLETTFAAYQSIFYRIKICLSQFFIFNIMLVKFLAQLEPYTFY